MIDSLYIMTLGFGVLTPNLINLCWILYFMSENSEAEKSIQIRRIGLSAGIRSDSLRENNFNILEKKNETK